MNIDSIKSTIRTIPSSAKAAVSSVGESTINGAKSAGNFISKYTPNAIKNIKMPQAIDTFVKSTKEKAFVQTISKNKNIITGTAVILAAIVSAISIAKSIVNKVKDIRNEKIATHQG